MGKMSLNDLRKANTLKMGLPSQEERARFKEEVIVGNDGVYLSYLSDFFDIVYPIEKFETRSEGKLKGVGVPEVEEKLEMAEIIPSEMIYRMVAWYRSVNERFGTEATMQVFYDVTGGENDFPDDMKEKYPGAVKRDGKFVFVIPEQNVTGGHVTFDGDNFPKGLNKELYEWALSNYEPILNIHSHNSMDAFWSGTDDANELPLYSRLCLVIGRVNTNHPTFRFSWNFEGKRHNLEGMIDDYIKPLEIVTAIAGMDYEEVDTKGFNEALGYIDFDKLTFDERWDDRIFAMGRFGSNRGVFKPLNELGKEEYQEKPSVVQGLRKPKFPNTEMVTEFPEDGLGMGVDLDDMDDEEFKRNFNQGAFIDESFDNEDDEDSDEDSDDAMDGIREEYEQFGTSKAIEPSDTLTDIERRGIQHTFRKNNRNRYKKSKTGNSAFDRYKRDQMNKGKKKYD